MHTGPEVIVMDKEEWSIVLLLDGISKKGIVQLIYIRFKAH
jgi:hypothetical protein